MKIALQIWNQFNAKQLEVGKKQSNVLVICNNNLICQTVESSVTNKQLV